MLIECTYEQFSLLPQVAKATHSKSSYGSESWSEKICFSLVWLLQVVETTEASVLVLSRDGRRHLYSTWSSSMIKSSIKAMHSVLVPSKTGETIEKDN